MNEIFSNDRPLVSETPFIPKVDRSSRLIFLGIIFIIILMGGFTGFLLSQNKTSLGLKINSGSKSETIVNPEVKLVQTPDRNRDCATGVLKKITKVDKTTEGSYLLDRGTPSQTVNLLSSSMELESYVGKKVEVCGETLPSQNVGWLLDVGRVTVK